MRRSMALGHCICDPRQACPCDELKTVGVCHCAGETRSVPDADAAAVKLTEYVRNPGCASKISKGILQQALGGLPEMNDPRVLVGATCGDDAGVMDLGGTGNTILTVDVFSPVVDDPYLFGQIAAANSLSDIYAMGGTPQAALSIIGFPVDRLPVAAMREILRGGADKMKEAGVPIIGGHSINDPEPKCGFAVLGTCPRGAFVRNAGARVGDVVVLTKPLGSGIVAFGRQIGRVGEEAVGEVAASMAALNKVAGERMIEHGVHAATDVTGFSLLGHMAEIVKNSDVAVDLAFDDIPLFTHVAELAAGEVLPGAVERNRESVAEDLLDLTELTVGQQGILFGPETSGGIVAFMPADQSAAFLRELHECGVKQARAIGVVTGRAPGGQIRVTKVMAQSKEFAMEETKATTADTGSCCCSNGHAAESALPAAASAEAFKTYMATVNAPGVLGVKQKKMILMALSIAGRCEPCVKINAKAARDAGATEAEIAEAADLGIAFGGAPAAMLYNTIRKG